LWTQECAVVFHLYSPGVVVAVAVVVVDIKPNQIRLGEHTDDGSVTLVFQRDVGGLQVLATLHIFRALPGPRKSLKVFEFDFLKRRDRTS